jgi:hypothetical protein
VLPRAFLVPEAIPLMIRAAEFRIFVWHNAGAPDIGLARRK